MRTPRNFNSSPVVNWGFFDGFQLLAGEFYHSNQLVGGKHSHELVVRPSRRGSRTESPPSTIVFPTAVCRVHTRRGTSPPTDSNQGWGKIRPIRIRIRIREYSANPNFEKECIIRRIRIRILKLKFEFARIEFESNRTRVPEFVEYSPKIRIRLMLPLL
jgi:hypothetical protein